MEKLAVHLADGFEEIEAVTIIDVLRRAGLNVITVSVTGKLLVAGAHQIEIMADQLFEKVDYSTCTMIILPGGMPGAKNLNAHEGLKNQIVEFHNNGKYLAAICAAPLVFGNLGILKGKRAVCYPGFESYLKEAEVLIQPVITSDNVITGRGVGAALHFSLEIVRLLMGVDVAEKLAVSMLIE